jgi:hypothetical protein
MRKDNNRLIIPVKMPNGERRQPPFKLAGRYPFTLITLDEFRATDCAFKSYCLAFGAASTLRHSAGNCAIVGPSLGLGGSAGGLGCSTSSLNQ